jgi:hypothetical protein
MKLHIFTPLIVTYICVHVIAMARYHCYRIKTAKLYVLLQKVCLECPTASEEVLEAVVRKGEHQRASLTK